MIFLIRNLTICDPRAIGKRLSLLVSSAVLADLKRRAGPTSYVSFIYETIRSDQFVYRPSARLPKLYEICAPRSGLLPIGAENGSAPSRRAGRVEAGNAGAACTL